MVWRALGGGGGGKDGDGCDGAGGNCSLESFQFPTNDPQALHVATAVPWPAGADRHKGITHIDALRAVKVERKTTLPQALSS